MDGPSPPMNVRRVLMRELIINRLHMLINGLAILTVFYYRATTLPRIIRTRDIPLLPYLIVIFSEIVLTFLWTLHQAYKWRPVKRFVYPERLPGDDKLPPVDAFVCTADPSKEPSLGVMNTVISAMALDYPPDKLSVYLHDDGGSYVTLNAVRESWKFARSWVPFCRKYQLTSRCPEVYFSGKGSENEKFASSSEYAAEKKIIERKYEEFHVALEKNSVNAKASVSRNHAPTVEVMTDEDKDSLKEMPLLVYVSREKRPGHPHHFKGGALNALLRVSALLTNAPYFLVLDCDMYCNDPSSARQAMCYYLDPKVSSQIAWVQFPQRFHNESPHDLYDSRITTVWRDGQGFDGLRGPTINGCNFFMSREAIYGSNKTQKDTDLNQLKKSFGASNEFIKTIYKNYKPPLPLEDRKPSDALQKEFQLLASCTYDNDTEWGKTVGYRYFTVVEDAITAIELHCNGWISVFVDPDRPCFLGACTESLNDMLVQQSRWSFGLMQIGLSWHSPLIYGPSRMSVLQSMCYSALVYDCLYALPFYGLAIIPPICLCYGIPLYPKVSDPFFIVFAYIFVAFQLKHVQEVLSYGDSFWLAVYELRVWMMKSGVCYVIALINAIMERTGLYQADFGLTNKVPDDEQTRRFMQGIYDFQASPTLLVPLCSLYILNLACFILGVARLLQKGDRLLVQAVLTFFAIFLNCHLLQGMFLRKDGGRVSPSITMMSVAVSAIIFGCGSLLLVY